jgi:hypothetical protein
MAVSGHTTGQVEHGGPAVPDAPGAAEFAGAIESFTELGNTAANLNATLTGHYQSLIEGHAASIKSAEVHG